MIIDGLHAAEQGAHLRWFITSDEIRGSGAGNALMGAAMAFCREREYRRVYLWTFDGLGAARHLYEKFGFRLVHQHRGSQWGAEVEEQRFELQADTMRRP
jgi:GNAT superfamily N-acetyltransferase